MTVAASFSPSRCVYGLYDGDFAKKKNPADALLAPKFLRSPALEVSPELGRRDVDARRGLEEERIEDFGCGGDGPGRTLGVGAAAAAPTGPSFGPASLGRCVRLRPPPRFSGRVGGSVAATTTCFDAAGGDFPA
uniref:Uncharacterized protein n=1 Tax=Leersia perrieri TaxID=77586 RepID=A0A0D9UXR0_9ORYZ